MSGDIRDELIELLSDRLLEFEGGNEQDDRWWANDQASDYADAIIARYPWITENPRLEHGHTERKSDAPFDPDFTYVYPGHTPSDPQHWRNLTRYVTPWTPSTKETDR